MQDYNCFCRFVRMIIAGNNLKKLKKTTENR